VRSSQNALVHGACTNEVREQAKRFNDLLRELKYIASTLDQG
jgi:hypothetical protein